MLPVSVTTPNATIVVYGILSGGIHPNSGNVSEYEILAN